MLAGPRAEAAFVLRAIQHPPWPVRVEDRAPLCVVAVARGHPWVVPDHGDPVRLHAEDVVLARGPEPYTVTDDPDTPVEVVIHPGPRQTTPAGDKPPDDPGMGARTWHRHAAGSTTMLVGKYRNPGEISRRLLQALPPLLVIPGHALPRRAWSRC